MAFPVNSPTTIMPPITVSSTSNPTLFEQPNDSVHPIKGGKSRRKKTNKKKSQKQRKRKTQRKTKTFLSKWMAIGK
jgi:hypothetical protein